MNRATSLNAPDAVISDEASVPADLLKWAMPAIIAPVSVGQAGERVKGLPDLPVDVRVQGVADRRHERVEGDQRDAVGGDRLLQQLVVGGQAQGHRVRVGDLDLGPVHQVTVGAGSHKPRHDGVFPAVLHGHVDDAARQAEE